MKARALAAASISLAFVALAGCGTLLGIDKDYSEGALDASGDGTVGDTSMDGAPVDGQASSDGSPGDGATSETGTDGSTCAGHICNGQCMAGTSCEGCAQGVLLCSATRACVSACTACASAPVECWSCAGPTPAGTCEPSATAYCFGAGYTHCTCGDAGPSTCPGATQICHGGKCETCGEPNTDGYRCKGFADCMESTKTCGN